MYKKKSVSTFYCQTIRHGISLGEASHKQVMACIVHLQTPLLAKQCLSAHQGWDERPSDLLAFRDKNLSALNTGLFTGWPKKQTTHKNDNNFYRCAAVYFIFGAHWLQFVQDHSTKFPVCRANGPTLMFSPKCVPNDPLGVAGTLANGALSSLRPRKQLE